MRGENEPAALSTEQHTTGNICRRRPKSQTRRCPRHARGAENIRQQTDMAKTGMTVDLQGTARAKLAKNRRKQVFGTQKRQRGARSAEHARGAEEGGKYISGMPKKEKKGLKSTMRYIIFIYFIKFCKLITTRQNL